MTTTKFYLISLFVLSLVVCVFSQATTNIIVDPSSTSKNVECGSTSEDACPSLNAAVYSFLNSTAAKSTKAGNQYPPLVIELIDGDYSTNTNVNSINLFGFDVTFQPFDKDEKITIPGVNNGGTLFVFDGESSIPSSASFTNITFNAFSSLFMYADMYTPLSLNFNGVIFSNSTAQLVFVKSNSADRAQITFEGSGFEGNSQSLLITQRADILFSNSVISKTTGSSVFYTSTNSVLNVTGSLIFQNNVPSANSLFYMDTGDINIIDTTVQDNTGNVVWATSYANVYIGGQSYILRNVGTNFGAFKIDQSSNLLIDSSTVNQNGGNYGGVVYSTSGSTVKITNSKLYNNYAAQGMLAYQSQSTLDITNSSVIYSNDYSSTYRIENMIYLTSNSASSLVNSSISLGSNGVASDFNLIDCNSGTMSYVGTNITLSYNFPVMACTQCQVSNDLSNAQDQMFNCPHDSSSSDASHHKNSSSNDKKPKNNHLLAKILIPIGIFMVIASIIVIVVMVKRRNRRNYHSI